MYKMMLAAGPVITLFAGTVCAGVGEESSPYDPYTLLNGYRFSEADLKKFERVHVTAGTALWGGAYAIQSATTGSETDSELDPTSGPEGINGSASLGSLFQWADAHDTIDPGSINQNTSGSSNLRISMPLVDTEYLVDDSLQQGAEELDVSVRSIPEPASMAMLGVGLLCICPQRRKRREVKA